MSNQTQFSTVQETVDQLTALKLEIETALHRMQVDIDNRTLDADENFGDAFDDMGNAFCRRSKLSKEDWRKLSAIATQL